MVDTIICLGSSFNQARTIEDMKLRTTKAVELYNQKRADKIIFTGGFRTRKDLSEAKFMANFSIELGVNKKDITLEEKANTTIGNAYYCKEVMEKNNIESAIVVTSPYHLKRARYIFQEIIPDKRIEYEKSKQNFGIFESIPYYLNEVKFLYVLKRDGLDYSNL